MSITSHTDKDYATGRKALSSFFKGEDYEQDVISSLEDITEKSEALRNEATKADMSQSAKNWRLAEQSKRFLLHTSSRDPNATL